MGMQIPYRVHPQVPTAETVPTVASAPWGGVPAFGPTEGEPDPGRALDRGSRAYVDLDPAQVRRGSGDRMYQKQECNPYRLHRGRQTEELHRRALVGPRLLRVHGRSGREGDPGIHPTSRAGGPPAGPDEDVRLTAAAGGSQTIRFELFTFQASNSAEGIDSV